MAAALVVAAILAWRMRWWLAALIGITIGEIAFLYWVPSEVWTTYFLGFLPFAGVPALLGAGSASWIRNKVMN